MNKVERAIFTTSRRPQLVCSRCNGEGFQDIEEDGRWCRDACYHCGTTGMCEGRCCNDRREMNRLAQLDATWLALARADEWLDRGGDCGCDGTFDCKSCVRYGKLRRNYDLLVAAGKRRNTQEPV